MTIQQPRVRQLRLPLQGRWLARPAAGQRRRQHRRRTFRLVRPRRGERTCRILRCPCRAGQSERPQPGRRFLPRRSRDRALPVLRRIHGLRRNLARHNLPRRDRARLLRSPGCLHHPLPAPHLLRAAGTRTNSAKYLEANNEEKRGKRARPFEAQDKLKPAPT